MRGAGVKTSDQNHQVANKGESGLIKKEPRCYPRRNPAK
jgi:hypothetical protein